MASSTRNGTKVPEIRAACAGLFMNMCWTLLPGAFKKLHLAFLFSVLFCLGATSNSAQDLLWFCNRVHSRWGLRMMDLELAMIQSVPLCPVFSGPIWLSFGWLVDFSLGMRFFCGLCISSWVKGPWFLMYSELCAQSVSRAHWRRQATSGPQDSAGGAVPEYFLYLTIHDFPPLKCLDF